MGVTPVQISAGHLPALVMLLRKTLTWNIFSFFSISSKHRTLSFNEKKSEEISRESIERFYLSELFKSNHKVDSFMKLWQLLSYLSYVVPKRNLSWTIIFSCFFLSFSPLFSSLTEKKIANVGQIEKNKCHFLYRLWSRTKFRFSLDLWFLFFLPCCLFTSFFYVVFQIFKMKHFCNELLHERTVNFGSDTKTESASPKKVESSAGTFDWSEERTGRTGAHCAVGCKNKQNIFWKLVHC